MKNNRFEPGQLAWTKRVDGNIICRNMHDEGLTVIAPGISVVVIRRAMAKDYCMWYQRSQYAPGKSYARMLAEQSWLVMPAGGTPILLQDSFLNTRQYKPRKKKS